MKKTELLILEESELVVRRKRRTMTITRFPYTHSYIINIMAGKKNMIFSIHEDEDIEALENFFKKGEE